MVLLDGLVDAAGGDGCRESFGNRFARVVGGFELRHPLSHGDPKNSGAHHQGQYKKHACRSDAPQRAWPVLRPQVDFENGEGNQVLGESHESEERPPESRWIETEGAFKDEKRQEKTDPEKPRCTYHQEEAKSPAAMRFKIASQRIAQRHAAAKPDEDGV